MKRKILLFSAIILAAIAAGLFFSLLTPNSEKEQWKIVAISPRASLLGIANQLTEEHLLSASGKSAFVVMSVLSGKARKLQPGRYRLSPSQSAWEILKWLAEGKVYVFRITIPEGFTLNQIGALLESEGIGTKQEFAVLTARNDGAFSSIVPKDSPSLEGYLFPDTYEIDGRQGQLDIVSKMLARFDEVVWQGLFKTNRNAGGLSRHQIITLASLVEGEAKLPAERPIIAGVLLNRLRKNMKLECDATVQYALGERRTRLTYRHLEVSSPYNTYLISGLPPGPICSPGKASIEAALHPAATPFLFYVARPDGSHIFSRTFSQHQAAISQIRRR